MILEIVILALVHSSLQLEPRSHLTSINHLQYYGSASRSIFEFMSITQWLGIIAVFAIVGYCCYKFRGFVDCLRPN